MRRASGMEPVFLRGPRASSKPDETERRSRDRISQGTLEGPSPRKSRGSATPSSARELRKGAAWLPPRPFASRFRWSSASRPRRRPAPGTPARPSPSISPVAAFGLARSPRPRRKHGPLRAKGRSSSAGGTELGPRSLPDNFACAKTSRPSTPGPRRSGPEAPTACIGSARGGHRPGFPWARVSAPRCWASRSSSFRPSPN